MRVVVIGGGVAGLTAAFRLLERSRGEGRDFRPTVLEAEGRAGGHAWTTWDEGFLIEAGPNGFLHRASEPETLVLARDLGLESALVPARPAARRRFVLRGGRLRRIPDSLPTLVVTDALTPAGKLRLMLESWARGPRGDGEESVFEFAVRRIGREAAEVLVDTAVAGISAGDSRTLSVGAAFPQMVEMEREHGSLIRAMLARRAPPPRLMSFTGGMAMLIEALCTRLGGALRTRCRVTRLERSEGEWHVLLEGGEIVTADLVILATPAARSAALLTAADPELARTLSSFPAAGLAVVALAYRTSDLVRPLDGYGYLVARSEGLDTLGVVWDSSLFDGRAPEGMVLVRAMLGGVRRPEVAGLHETELVARARRELALVRRPSAAPVRTWVWRWPQAIVQYTRGHLERVARVRALAAAHPGLELCGTSYEGVSFGAAVSSAARVVERLLGEEARFASARTNAQPAAERRPASPVTA